MPDELSHPAARASAPDEPPRYRSHQGVAAGTASLAADIGHAVRDGYDLARATLSAVDRTARRWPLLALCAATMCGYLAAGRTPAGRTRTMRPPRTRG